MIGRRIVRRLVIYLGIVDCVYRFFSPAVGVKPIADRKQVRTRRGLVLVSTDKPAEGVILILGSDTAATVYYLGNGTITVI